MSSPAHRRGKLRVVQLGPQGIDNLGIPLLLERAGLSVEVKRVSNNEEMLVALDSADWDAVVGEYVAPGTGTRDALKLVLERRIPFILISDAIGEVEAVAMIKAGASHLVLKSNLLNLGSILELEIAEARKRTGRLNAEARDRISEARYKLAVHAAGLGTWDHDILNDALTWAGCMRTHFGLTTAETPTFEMFLAAIHPDDRDRVERAIGASNMNKADGRYQAEFRVIGVSDGVERSISAWGMSQFDELGQVSRRIGVTTDVTSRKRLEHQLRQAQKLDAIGQLAGGIAHEFNNLLTVIVGYSNMIETEAPMQPGHQRLMGEISKAAMSGASLTRQLLTFSRQLPSNPRLFDLNSAVTEGLRMLRPLLGANIELKLLVGVDISAIRADPDQINQMLVNLALNARDAMRAGGQLIIETCRVSINDAFASGCMDAPRGNYAAVSVTDTGTGMDAATLERIFEPFFTTKEPGKGTGLGLSTVYGIVQQSAGYISVHSLPGLGSTFRVLFPLIDAVPAVDQPHSETLRAKSNVSGSETILLAEDEGEVRQYIYEILTGSGYRVLAAPNGYAALSLSKNYPHTIHLLLTDVMMPEMNGLELARELTILHPEADVLFLTGYAWHVAGPSAAESRKTGNSPAECDYLEKPFEPMTLLARIRAVLNYQAARLGQQSVALVVPPSDCDDPR
jgi:two-component system cell cycle sensor histidine kinase/response regulator CckA